MDAEIIGCADEMTAQHLERTQVPESIRRHEVYEDLRFKARPSLLIPGINIKGSLKITPETEVQEESKWVCMRRGICGKATARSVIHWLITSPGDVGAASPRWSRHVTRKAEMLSVVD